MKSALATGAAAFAAPSVVVATQTQRAGYVSGAIATDGTRVLVGLSLEGEELFALPASVPTHGAAPHPNGLDVAVVDQRYGQSIKILDRTTGDVATTLAPKARHSFHGHGTYLLNGTIFAATEVDYGSGEGWISFWNVGNGYEKNGNIASGGLGAEDVMAVNDTTLVVSNTGLQTSPLTGLEKRNIFTMEPNLTYLTMEGKIIRQVSLPASLQMQAIRHLDVSQTGQVAFSMTGEAGDTRTPYFGLQNPNAPARLIALPSDPLVRVMSENAKAVFSTDGTQVAVVLPDRDRVHILSTNDLSLLLSWQYEGVESIAPLYDSGFMVSGSDGRLYALQADNVTLIRQSRRAWSGLLTALF